MTKQLATTITRIDPECIAQLRDDFDTQVSIALKEGWRLVAAGVTDLFLWAIMEGELL